MRSTGLLPNFENDVSVKTVGFIVNPIAGMGGAVGLKGTDGRAVLKRAVVLGAKPVAPASAKSFLSELKPVKRSIRLVVGAGRMGEDEARSCGFACAVLGKRKKPRLKIQWRLQRESQTQAPIFSSSVVEMEQPETY